MTPRERQVWELLSKLPDPELPAVSLGDLGIVRDVSWEEGKPCAVTITPTYSGCPAMGEIAESIERALDAHGVEEMLLHTQLSPAWTTTWMTEPGKRRLKAYGIAPPLGAPRHCPPRVGERDPNQLLRRPSPTASPECPRCDSDSTRLLSHFGSTPCKALYVCSDCQEPFEHFKDH